MGISVFPIPSSAGLIRKSQTFTSSGTFTLPTGYGAGQPLIIDAEVCGGGGGGGSGAYDAVGATNGAGGGGSGVCIYYENITLTSNATITIGAGGNGGAAVSGGTGNYGANGGSSDINSIFYAAGGGGGGRGLHTAATNYAYSVNSNGFLIPGGGQASVSLGPGGAGGSGGNRAISITANPDNGTTYRGGIYGLPGTAFGDGGPNNSNLQPFNPNAGSGLNFSIINGVENTAAGLMGGINLRQRGGGGGAGRATTDNTAGGGGGAGTRTTGGLNGVNNSGAGKNGQSATDNGCGGGGGGASRNNGGVSGAGGNGAGGYVTIFWWG
jgi:hypothetical protein